MGAAAMSMDIVTAFIVYGLMIICTISVSINIILFFFLKIREKIIKYHILVIKDAIKWLEMNEDKDLAVIEILSKGLQYDDQNSMG